jgi:hypothetical protein
VTFRFLGFVKKYFNRANGTFLSPVFDGEVKEVNDNNLLEIRSRKKRLI